MSGSTPGPGADEPVPSPVALGPFDVPLDSEVKPGHRWRDFAIEARFPDGGANAYLADHIGLMEKVVVRAYPLHEATEWRRGAWERLCQIADSKVVRCIEVREDSGWRYEVSAVPPPMTLRDWLGCHHPGFSDIEVFVRQMAATLGALHAQGVVHLNIRPETIHLDETGRDPIFLLGGLRDATLYTQAQLTELDVDPFYVPPEAMELATLRSGTRLCAWDWWSVGRVVQEMLLGQHVLGLVLNRDVSKSTMELRAHAAALLRETAPPDVRAGALDYMPPDPSTSGLLRGLLTSSSEARWGLDAVQRWLRREAVRDHYDLPKAARLWVWRGRGFALPEAVEFFTQAANWSNGEDALFDQQDPESLVRFLSETTEYRADADRFHGVCDFMESLAGEDVPMVARRTLTAALAWLALAVGRGIRVPLRLRGQAIDQAGLTQLLAQPNGEGVALATALMAPAVTNYLEKLDVSAARALKALAATGGAAVRLAIAQGWLDADNSNDQGRMLTLALQRTAVLRERAALLASTYATNRRPELASLLAKREASPMELVLLVFTGEAPEHYGYVTHSEWRREREADLSVQARRIGKALGWVRLRRVLTVAIPWSLPWQVFMGITFALTVTAAWFARAPEPAAVVAAALVLSRAWLWFRLGQTLRRLDPAAVPWTWRDGWRRADAEAKRQLAEIKLTPTELSAENRRLCAALSEFVAPKIARQATAGLGEAEIGFVLIVGAGMAGLALVLALLTPPAARKAPLPPIAAVAKPGAPEVKPLVPEPPITPGSEQDFSRLLATGKYEVLDDGFGRRLRGPLLQWDLTAPAVVETIAVEASARASPQQSAFALVSGNLLVQPYTRKSVNALVAVQVPTTRGTGILIFNTRDRQLVDRDVLLVGTPLQERTWYRLGSRQVVFLGTPPALAAEISLAPP